MADILRLGIFTGLRNLRRERLAEREAREDRSRRRTLDDLVLKERQAGAQRAAAQDARDAARDDQELRAGGSVPTSEATGDPHPTILPSRTLEDVLRATMDGPGIRTPAAADARLARYGTEVGGYRYDQFSDAARGHRARARRLEHLASPRPEEPREPSLSERRQHRLEGRIAELRRGGLSLSDANRQARMELGGSVPSLDSRVRGAGSESPVVRDARRSADRDLKLLNTTERKIRDVRRELGTVNLQSPRPEDRPKIEELKRLEATADSLRGSAFRHSSTASTAAATSSPRTVAESTPLQRDLVAARQAYDALLSRASTSADSAAAEQRYKRVVAAIMAKHQGQEQR